MVSDRSKGWRPMATISLLLKLNKAELRRENADAVFDPAGWTRADASVMRARDALRKADKDALVAHDRGF